MLAHQRICLTCQAPTTVKAPLEIAKWQDYKILNQKGTVAEVTTWSDEKEFADMHEALLKLGFSEDQARFPNLHLLFRGIMSTFAWQRCELYIMLKFVLFLGNISFRAGKEGSEVSSDARTVVLKRKDTASSFCFHRSPRQSCFRSAQRS